MAVSVWSGGRLLPAAALSYAVRYHGVVTPYPNMPAKHGAPALVEPRAYLDYLVSQGLAPGLPELHGAILCYEPELVRRLRQSHGVEQVRGALRHYLHAIPGHEEIVLGGGFGIGAPVAAAVMEELVALGCRRFVSIGTAGTLRPDLAVGELVVCDRSIRDEGTSYHYQPAAKFAYPAAGLTAGLRAALERRGRRPVVGASWTTDAVYRETVEEARAYQAEGVAVVEMEAASLFAVAAYRGVEAAAVFTVSDSLADLVWRPDFAHPEVWDALETMFAAALDVLAAPPAEQKPAQSAGPT
jgi:uridine phosphorylase